MNIKSIDDGQDVSKPGSLYLFSDGQWSDLREYITKHSASHDRPRIWKFHDRVMVFDWITICMLADDQVPKIGSPRCTEIVDMRFVLNHDQYRKLGNKLAKRLETKFNCHSYQIGECSMLEYFVISFDDIRDSLMFKLTSLSELMNEYENIGYIDVSHHVIVSEPTRSQPSTSILDHIL
jgi:hypothetical protein